MAYADYSIQEKLKENPGIRTYFFFGLLMILGGIGEVCDLMEIYQSTHIYTIPIQASIAHIRIRYCSFKLTFSDVLWTVTW